MHGVADIQTDSKKLHAEAEDNPSYKRNKSGGIVFMDDNDGARRMVEQCYLKRKTTINPIVDWTDDDVWEFLNDVVKVPHCCLYDEGFTRLGCIGCPLQGREGMLRDFERWPGYKKQYIRALDKMIANHPGEIKVATGELVDNSNGGVQRYTQDGSHGTPDGFGDEFVHETDESGNPAAERERERDAGQTHESTDGSNARTGNRSSLFGSTYSNEQTRETASMVADDDSRGKSGILDKQLLSGEAADTHTHTQAQAIQAIPRAKRSGTACQADVDAPLNGMRYLNYWLWRCRNDQMDWSAHPLRKHDPKAQEYAETLIPTRE